ncbi:MAG: EAL domain-containing protein [Candidatus Marithrix sp.]|nr:EAL domain-containing protein [Candidatus Marithrix sp.]
MMQSDIIRLIVIEESANDAEVILNSLRKARYPIRPTHVEDDEDLQDALTEHEWDLIISVPEVGDFTVSQVCEMVASSKQDIPVIVISDNFDCKVISKLFDAGVKRVIPNDNTGSCLPGVVGFELNNLAERRKLQHIEQLYKESQKNNKMLLATSRDAIAYVHEGMHIYANPSYLKMFSYKNMDDLEGSIMDLVAINDQPKFKDFMREFMNDERLEERQITLEGLRSNKKKFKLAMEFSPAIYDSERCIQVIIREQSQGSKEMEKQLLQIARRDQLTGLFNRQFFLELLDNSLAKAVENHTRSRLFYIALDNFEQIKETAGIAGCDPIIKNVAKVIKKIAGNSASLARFDEGVFTLLIADKECKKCAGDGPAKKICKIVADTVTESGGQSIIVTCSIGIAQIIASVAKPEDVLTDAHAACRNVVENGGNNFEIYKATVKADQDNITSSDIANIIESAIEDKRMSLRYQPIINLHDDEGGENQEIYEVLLRIMDDDGNLFPTGKIFTDAENANLSTKLDRWVLQEAVKSLVEQEGEISLFIKLSDQAIKDDSILLFIRKLLRSYKLPGERLVFEVSESIAITQIAASKAFITQLKSLNCRSALEHFGTGLNPETTLTHLPVNYIKIDGVFSRDLSTDTENQEAVGKLVKLAHNFEMKVIAEAVEDANSLTVLWSSEVDFAQGHYLQEPLEDLDFDFSDEDDDEDE